MSVAAKLYPEIGPRTLRKIAGLNRGRATQVSKRAVAHPPESEGDEFLQAALVLPFQDIQRIGTVSVGGRYGVRFQGHSLSPRTPLVIALARRRVAYIPHISEALNRYFLIRKYEH